MNYNFDTLHHRTNTNSIKWDFLNENGVYVAREVGSDPVAEGELLPMGLADMDFPTAQPIIDAMLARTQHGIFGYTRPTDSYYASIINWFKQRSNWDVQADWIFSVSGVMPAINLLIQTLTEPGDQVIIQTPVFYPFYHAVEFNNRQLVRNQLRYENGHYSIDFDDLAAKAADSNAKMLVLCSPHNPVGRVWSREELTRLGEICDQNDLLIVSDELHSDLTYSSASFTAFGTLDARFNDRLIVCTGPSKAFNLPGLKIALTIIPNQTLREQFASALNNLNELFGANTLGTLALQTAYENGQEWLMQLVAYLEGNVAFLQTYVKQNMPQLSVIEADALFLSWIDCSALTIQSNSLKQLLLKEAKVYVESGSMYGAEGEGFIRVNIGCPRPILAEALERIRRVIDGLTAEVNPSG